MQKDRSNWTVRRVGFAEAEELDNQYYASLSELERLEILMGLRSMVGAETEKIIPVVYKHHIHEKRDEV